MLNLELACVESVVLPESNVSDVLKPSAIAGAVDVCGGLAVDGTIYGCMSWHASLKPWHQVLVKL